MIAFFPSLYPDELLYSAFSRYFDRSGYGIYRAAAEDLYVNPLVKPDMLFVNKLRQEVIEILLKQKSFEDIVTQHTMFPYYGRFLPSERRHRALQSLITMDSKHKDALQMPKDGKSGNRYLRYCPCCYQKDRQIYGEAYWHRIHQMHDIAICQEHGCYLIDSDVSIRGYSSPGLFSAESSVDSMIIRMGADSMEHKIAQYIAELSNFEVTDSDAQFHLFLHERIAGSKYTSPRGEQKNLKIFFHDFMQYYSCYTDNPIKEIYQFQKIIDGHRYSTKCIAMISMFIGIPPEELAEMKMPAELHKDAFDRHIRELHQKGMNYAQIARIMSAPYAVCKSIGEGRYYKTIRGKGSENKGGVRKKNWDKIDRQLLPKVKNAIEAISIKDGKPCRVTYNAVAKYLEMPEKQFENLPLCKKEIEKQYECWEHFWAREMVFYYKDLVEREEPVTATKIRRLTNAKTENLRRGLPFLTCYTDLETAKIIMELFK